MASRPRIAQVLKDQVRGRIRRGAKIAPYTSFGIGGRASYLIDVDDPASLVDVIKVLRQHRMKYFLIGKGTNLLVADRGYDGALIRLQGEFTRISVKGTRLRCGAGALLAKAAQAARRAGLSGLEFASGIPGSVGGAVKMNAGAFGETVGPLVDRVGVLGGRLEHRFWTRKNLAFSYRTSNITGGAIVTTVVFRLKPDDRRAIERKERLFRQTRQARQPWGKSAGSIFKNPPDIPAGRLIEQCGLKGRRIGGAVVSEKHANFIINRKRASCRDVKRLIDLIKKTVHRKTGVSLREEVISLG